MRFSHRLRLDTGGAGFAHDSVEKARGWLVLNGTALAPHSRWLDMKITFLGGAREVTGSMFLLESSAGRLLIDCGLHQGPRAESRRRNRELPREAVGADVVLVTHAHVDHSGSLPTLVKAGFSGAIYSTPATRSLASHMLRDAARIQESDAAYLNRKFGEEPGFVEVEPLYDEEDAIRALERMIAVPYEQAFEPIPGVKARFLEAGHILGSAQIVVDVAEPRSHRRVVFSGDLGRKGLPIIRDPARPPANIDYVVLESTYGGRAHEDIARMNAELARVVREAVERNGKVIVPAFSLGRTQELVYALNGLFRAGTLPPIPVFIDSPLGVNVTEVFRMHPECFDSETRAFQEEHGDPFGFQTARFVSSRAESIQLNALAGPAVIIAASGMAEAGRILHHLKNHVENPHDTILIVGFMAQHTLGRRILERRPKVKIWGVERDLKARVEVLNGFSAHADRNDLLAYARQCGPSTRKFFLVHGEPEQQLPLAAALEREGLRVAIPSRNETLTLD